MSSRPGKAANRFEALDGWRGICACLVVLFHFHAYSPLYRTELVRHSFLFVDFFFVLSGFVIAYTYAARLDSWDGLKRFLVLRVGRVYPLHAFMLLLFVAYEIARLVKGPSAGGESTAFMGANHPLAILSNLVLVQSLDIHDSLTWNGPAWSISTEWWTYVIFALVSVWLGMRNWVLLLAALTAPMLLLHLSKSGMNTTYDYGLIRCVFGFALGVACYRLHQAWPALARGSTPTVMTVLEVLVVAAVVLFVSAAGEGVWSLAAPVVFAAAVLVFAIEGGAVSRLFRFRALNLLGTLSYSIYLTHAFFVMLFPQLFKLVTHLDLWTPMRMPDGTYILAYGRNDFEGLAFTAAVLGITLAFSALTYRWIETPGREWTRRFVNRAKPAAGAADAPRAGAIDVAPTGASSQRT